jgi:hypothetical protein
MEKRMKKAAILIISGLFLVVEASMSQKSADIIFGRASSYNKFINGSKENDQLLKWINVNTAPDTWYVEKDMLVCSGKPIGVMRSEKQYENFILHIEWMHMEKGGNSGVFVWSGANPPEGQNLPDGVEVQMLELGWVELNKKDGVAPPLAYVHGELFGVGGVKTIPDNPRGTRSKSVENRCKGKGEWNTYDVVCVDGVIRLSVNGKFVNGITRSSQKKGYICLESEGAEIHFRNLKIIELDAGVTAQWQTAPDLNVPVPAGERKPLSLHPGNPHYFLFRDKPTVLIGSTEHYGAVMNLDFDYVTYLNELAACGLNVTRTFSGVYVEPQGAFKIERNSLAPASGRFICPWARSEENGYANGGNKFDLTKWNDEYFTRLKDFVREAGKRDVVVELDLFSNFYDTIQWKLSPLYHKNNVNGTGNFESWKEALSLKHPEVLAAQESMARKIVSELREFDNLYYEVCNEPYFGDTISLRQWENHMTAVVADAEKDFKYRHLISNNIQNHHRLVPQPRPDVSIYNFHYASPPKTVYANYHLNMPIGDNETGFSGIEDAPYRKEAWAFLLAGGALYNNLDYSFTADTEDGTFVVKKPQPGGGGKSLRSQLRILAGFMNSLDFINMKPAGADQVRIVPPSKASVNALSKGNEVMALYVSNIDKAWSGLELNLPAASYRLTIIDVMTGDPIIANIAGHKGGWLKISSEGNPQEFALKIEKTGN